MRLSWYALIVLGITLAPSSARGAQDSGVPAPDPAPVVVRLDARAPWEAEGRGVRKLRPATGDPRLLVMECGLPETHSTAGAEISPTMRIRLRLAALPDVARRWPVGLSEPFEVTVDLSGVVGDSAPAPDVALFCTDAHWRTQRIPGAAAGAANTAPWPHPARRMTLSLPPAGASDLTELGIAINWTSHAAPPAGTISISIDRLVLRAAARHEPPVPPEGNTVTTLGGDRAWRTDGAYQGIESVAQTDGGTMLRCNLDWKDRQRYGGVVWVDVTDAGRPIDLAARGVFVTVRCRRSIASAPLIGFRVCTGLRDADGRVFWGQSQEVVADGFPATAGAYPETRFPLPHGFCAERFDPTHITAVGVRLDVVDDKRRTFSGPVTIDRLRIVDMPDDFRAQRERIADRIGRENWLSARATRGAATRADPVPIATFCENVGVNYPWPKDVYAGVGRRPWNPAEGGFSACADRIVQDFAYLAAQRVRLVRVFIFCDGRTGIIADGRGGLALDPLALADVRALLAAVAKFDSLRLVPVLFDFLIGDGVEREDFALVGEHPDWLCDPDKCRALLDAVQPVIDLLCAHPQVAFIDLLNEPEHAAAVGADDMRAFLSELADRVHRHPRHIRCTVGSANALSAPFWRPTGIDFPTCHWFEKIDASHLLGERAAALDPNVALMTEVDPGVDVEAALSRLWQAGFRGGLFWSLNAGDAYEFRGPPADALKRWVEEHAP